MIKKHDHRKQNRQLLKLPKNAKLMNDYEIESMLSSNYESDTNDDKSSFIRSKGAKMNSGAHGDTASTNSRASSNDKNSSRLTKLSKVKAEAAFDH